MSTVRTQIQNAIESTLSPVITVPNFGIDPADADDSEGEGD